MSERILLTDPVLLVGTARRTNRTIPAIRRISSALLLVLALSVLLTPARAQEAGGTSSSTTEPNPQSAPADSVEDPAVQWSAEVSGSYLRLGGERSPWTRQSVFVEAAHASGTYRIGIRRARQFGASEAQLVAEAYPGLWSGAYLHLRLLGSRPGRTAPQVDGLARLYHTFGRWELNGGARIMEFADARPIIASVGIGRYGSGWYGTVTGRIVRSHGRSGWSLNGLLRWYLSGAETYLDLRGGRGREVVVVGPGPATELLTSVSGSAALRTPLSERLALRTEMRYVDQPGLDRWGGSVAIEIAL